MPRKEYAHDDRFDNEDYNAREREAAQQAADERDEAIALYERTSEETPHCEPACSAAGASEHTVACRISNELERINALLAPRIGPGLALIGNGLFVRTGSKRQRAAARRRTA